MARQEVLQRLLCRLLQLHVHLNPSGGESDGVQHSAAAGAEGGDPGEQGHYQSWKSEWEIDEHGRYKMLKTVILFV